jgi:ribosomal protein L17
MPNRVAKRKAKLDRVVAGNEVFHNIYNVEYHETSKYKYNQAKRERKARKLAKTNGAFSTSNGRNVAVRLTNTEVLPVTPKRARTMTTVIDGITRITRKHKMQGNVVDAAAYQERKQMDIMLESVAERRLDPNAAGGHRS